VRDSIVETWRKKLPKDGRRRKWFNKAALPVSEPSEFKVDKGELAVQLMPSPGNEAERVARSVKILDEAHSIYQSVEDRGTSAGTRAATLQEAVGIAATLLITGAGLIVGQSALEGFGCPSRTPRAPGPPEAPASPASRQRPALPPANTIITFTRSPSLTADLCNPAALLG
jgi:hypothetical protein